MMTNLPEYVFNNRDCIINKFKTTYDKIVVMGTAKNKTIVTIHIENYLLVSIENDKINYVSGDRYAMLIECIIKNMLRKNYIERLLR